MRGSWKLPLQVLQLCTVTAKPHRKQKMYAIFCAHAKHTHIQEDFCSAFAAWQCFPNMVAQTFLTVSHSDMSDLVKSNIGF